MTFISSSEANNVYFMSGKAMNEIYFFLASLDEINGIFMTKMNFLFYFVTDVLHYTMFDVVHDRPLRYTNNDVT